MWESHFYLFNSYNFYNRGGLESSLQEGKFVQLGDIEVTYMLGYKFVRRSCEWPEVMWKSVTILNGVQVS